MGRSAIDVLAVLGRSCLFLFHALVGRGGIGGGFQLLTKQLYSVGVLSLAIVVVSGVFIGMVLALQGYSILTKYGSEQAVGQMVALTLLRELGPVVTALLFAGRAGSALTAEIGNMKSTEQLSSLEMIGVDPLKYIVAPRLWAGFISLPLLALIFSVVGIWGGSWVAVDWLGVYEAPSGPTCRTVFPLPTTCSTGWSRAWCSPSSRPGSPYSRGTTASPPRKGSAVPPPRPWSMPHWQYWVWTLF